METAKPMPPLKIDYLKCTRPGMHDQQNLNLVCLEKGCLDNLVGCCACFETDHKKHKTKPLKMVVGQARDLKDIVKPVPINIDIMLDILKQQEDSVFEMFRAYRKKIVESLQGAEKKLAGYFNHMSNQILLTNSDSHLMLQQIIQRALTPKDSQQLTISLKKIIALQDQQSGKNLSEEQLRESIQQSNKNLQQTVKLYLDEAQSKLLHLQDKLGQFMENSNLWQAKYKFSQTLRHGDIKVVSDSRIKSINSQCYKFGLMDPEVQKGARKTFSFCVKELKSNWLAFGFADKNTVKSKGFTFKFGSTGHGAYLMSSNGGSWSNHKADQNNTIKGIKFAKGDTVHATIDSETSTIKFRKNTNPQTYELAYQLTDKQELSPCVLFYYKDDEVEYLDASLK